MELIFIRERIFFFFKEINQYRKWEIEIIKAHIAGVQRSLKETRERGREWGQLYCDEKDLEKNVFRKTAWILQVSFSE